MTLEELERTEGGTVKESQVGMAHTKRAARRKEKVAKDGMLSHFKRLLKKVTNLQANSLE